MQVSAESKSSTDLNTPPLSKGEQCRLLLLDAAHRVIIAKGAVEAVTHRSVAAEAEVSRGTTTYHFESRNKIVVLAFRHYIGTVNSILSTTFEELARTGEESIIEFLLFQQREFRDPELIMAEYDLILHAARNEELGRD